MKEIKIGLIGAGVIGSGVIALLKKNRELIKKRSGCLLTLKSICDLQIKKKNWLTDSEFKLTTDYRQILNDPEIEIVIELIGGTTAALDVILGALKAQKHIVTANKAALSMYYSRIFKTACEHKREVYFEGAIGGGIPIIKVLREGLVGNSIKSIHCIINGTCNFILSKMNKLGMSFSDALADAQRLGFAEANPDLDINGHDAAHKTALLAMLAFNTDIDIRKVYTEGINSLQAIDLAHARELGYTVKLLGIAKNHGSKMEVRVNPCLIPEHSSLGSVENEYNAVLINSDFLGTSLYYGKGAGSYPTASAIASDLTDIAKDIRLKEFNKYKYMPFNAKDLMTAGESAAKYYIRINTIERPGIFSSITAVFARYKISLEKVIQKDFDNLKNIPIMFVTRTCSEKSMTGALGEISRFPFVKGKPVFLRIEEL